MSDARPLLLYVVDDDVTWLRALARVLEHAGAEVRAFEDGVGLLERLEDELPDLVVIDFDLGPGGTGSKLARELRQALVTSCPPLVLLTAQLDHVVDRELVAFDLALSKATPPKALVEKLLGRAGERQGARSAPRLRGEPTGELGARDDAEKDAASG
ncbi:MAG: response regulator [Sandaracinaceae bacterium]|nr:response regulator [Sandaracinaceae bacterium]